MKFSKENIDIWRSRGNHVPSARRLENYGACNQRQWPCDGQSQAACFTTIKSILKQTKLQKNKTAFWEPAGHVCAGAASRWRALPKTRTGGRRTGKAFWKRLYEFPGTATMPTAMWIRKFWFKWRQNMWKYGIPATAVRLISFLLTSIAGLELSLWRKNRSIAPGTKSKWFHAIVRYSLYEADLY